MTIKLFSQLATVGLVLSSGALLQGCDAYENIRRAMGKSPAVYDTSAPTLPSDLGPRPRILIFSKTNGFRHSEAIAAAQTSVEAIAKENGWTVFSSENAAIFNDQQLAQFDVIFGNNCTGDNWSEDQRAAFKRYIDTGGGFVGVHGAAGTRFEFWDWYQQDLLKGRFIGHPLFPQIQTATVNMENRDHPATEHFSASWEHQDEWYSFGNNPRDDGATVLATLDETSYSPKALGDDLRMGDHPIIWSHCIGDNGRVFYSALGHEAATYQRPEHAQMLSGALSWAMGLEGSCP